jgi:hypothetical protein
MPLYYFHTFDGKVSIDEECSELSGTDEARQQYPEHAPILARMSPF